jgi:hypothetical protein
MPIVTARHLEIGTEFKHEYILRVEIIKKKITGRVLEATELATLNTFKVIFGNYVSGTYPKENMNRYMFLSYIICCQFFPLFAVNAYGRHIRFGHFEEEKNS